MFRIRYKIIGAFLLISQPFLFYIHYQLRTILKDQWEEQVRQQMLGVAQAITYSDFLKDPQLLRKIKQLIQADLVVCNPTFHILSSTLSSLEERDLVLFLQGLSLSSDPRLSAPKSSLKAVLLFRSVPLDQNKYALVLTQTLFKTKTPLLTLLLFPEERFILPQTQATQTITRAMQWSTFFTIIVGIVLSLTITRPLEQLSAEAQRIATGNFTEPVKRKSRDEVGALALSFNQMQKELKKTQKNLLYHEHLSTLGKITARVAHEIRNPLTAMRMSLENAIRKVKQEKLPALPSLEMVVGEIDRLELLVQGLLTFSPLQKLDYSSTSLSTILHEVLHLLTPRLQHLKIHLNLQEDSQLPKVFMDAHKIKQVLFNLLLNALQAMPQGGTLTIKTFSPPQELEVQIQDTGKGVSLLQESHLFESFFTTRSDGTGLGLATCREIIEAHHGKIGYTRLALGSQFWFKIPQNLEKK